MLCSTKLRAHLNNEIVEALSSTAELRPYLTAWAIIEARFRGLDALDQSLDPVSEVHCKIMREQKRTGLITEELFISWVMLMKVHTKNIVCRVSGKVWEPIMQSFSEFQLGASDLIISDSSKSDAKVQQFYLWVLQLCNWDGESSVNLPHERLH